MKLREREAIGSNDRPGQLHEDREQHHGIDREDDHEEPEVNLIPKVRLNQAAGQITDKVPNAKYEEDGQHTSDAPLKNHAYDHCFECNSQQPQRKFD